MRTGLSGARRVRPHVAICASPSPQTARRQGVAAPWPDAGRTGSARRCRRRPRTHAAHATTNAPAPSPGWCSGRPPIRSFNHLHPRAPAAPAAEKRARPISKSNPRTTPPETARPASTVAAAPKTHHAIVHPRGKIFPPAETISPCTRAAVSQGGCTPPSLTGWWGNPALLLRKQRLRASCMMHIRRRLQSHPPAV